MTERDRGADLTPEEIERLKKVAKSQEREVVGPSFSISKEAVDKISVAVGYEDDYRDEDEDYYSVDPSYVSMKSARFAEEFTALLLPDDELDHSGLLDGIEGCLVDRYGNKTERINAPLTGMSVIFEASHLDYGPEFLDRLKNMQEEEVVDTFSDYGKFPSEKTIIERARSEKMPTFENEELRKLLERLYYDFNYISRLGDQVRDGAEFAYFFINRNNLIPERPASEDSNS